MILTMLLRETAIPLNIALTTHLNGCLYLLLNPFAPASAINIYSRYLIASPWLPPLNVICSVVIASLNDWTTWRSAI